MREQSVHHIIAAYGLHGDGSAENLPDGAIIPWLNDSKLAWAHLDAAHPDTRKWLNSKAVKLDRFVIDALLSEETRPRMLRHGDGCLLILRGVNLNENAQPEDMVSIRIWAEKHRIITLRRRPLKAANDIENQLKAGIGPKDTGEFITSLVSRLSERMEPVLSGLDDQMDDIEEAVLDNVSADQRSSIVNLRKQAIVFRRYIGPQRDAIFQLRTANLPWLSEDNGRHLLESHNYVLRQVEDLDAMRERAQIVKEELAAMIADRMNKNMYVLSVIAAIFLPLGFLTGLLGINVGGIPGADNPAAFWIFIALMGVIVTIQIFIFKKLKWF